MDVTPYHITEASFDVDVRVSVSVPFFAWVFGFAGDMTIVGPESVRGRYLDALRIGMEEVSRE